MVSYVFSMFWAPLRVYKKGLGTCEILWFSRKCMMILSQNCFGSATPGGGIRALGGIWTCPFREPSVNLPGTFRQNLGSTLIFLAAALVRKTTDSTHGLITFGATRSC